MNPAPPVTSTRRRRCIGTFPCGREIADARSLGRTGTIVTRPASGNRAGVKNRTCHRQVWLLLNGSALRNPGLRYQRQSHDENPNEAMIAPGPMAIAYG